MENSPFNIFSILMFSLISKSRIDLELLDALKSSDFIGGAVAHHLLSHLQLDSGTYLLYLHKNENKKHQGAARTRSKIIFHILPFGLSAHNQTQIKNHYRIKDSSL